MGEDLVLDQQRLKCAKYEVEALLHPRLQLRNVGAHRRHAVQPQHSTHVSTAHRFVASQLTINPINK